MAVLPLCLRPLLNKCGSLFVGGQFSMQLPFLPELKITAKSYLIYFYRFEN